MMALIAIMGLTSCTKKPEDLIVGKWKITEFRMRYSDGSNACDFDATGETWTFKENGSFIGCIPIENDIVPDYYFTSKYIVEGEELTIRGGDFEYYYEDGFCEEVVFVLDIDEITKDELSVSGKWKFYEGGELLESASISASFKRK